MLICINTWAIYMESRNILVKENNDEQRRWRKQLPLNNSPLLLLTKSMEDSLVWWIYHIFSNIYGKSNKFFCWFIICFARITWKRETQKENDRNLICFSDKNLICFWVAWICHKYYWYLEQLMFRQNFSSSKANFSDPFSTTCPTNGWKSQNLVWSYHVTAKAMWHTRRKSNTQKCQQLGDNNEDARYLDKLRYRSQPYQIMHAGQ